MGLVERRVTEVQHWWEALTPDGDSNFYPASEFSRNQAIEASGVSGSNVKSVTVYIVRSRLPRFLEDEEYYDSAERGFNGDEVVSLENSGRLIRGRRLRRRRR